MPSREPTSDRIHSFEELISPIPAQHFLREIFGKRPVRIGGTPHRFQHLLTWGALNAILAERPAGSLNIRVMKDGAEIPQEQYTQHVQSEFLGKYLQLSVGPLAELLQQGATLVVNRFRELHGPTRILSEILEQFFSSYVEVVVFAGWHGTRGLASHWDPEETFILQLEGEKHWRIWYPTRRYPLVQDRRADAGRPTDLCWEGNLSAGDLLHIPRGWWHDATPVAAPSLHITFAVRPPTGIELARAVLMEVEVLRQNVPRHRTEAEEAEYATLFRSAVSGALEQVSLARFFKQLDSNVPTGARLSLPWSAVPDYHLPESARLQWQPRRGLPLDESEETLTLHALGSTYAFSKVAKQVLLDLMHTRSTTVKELCERHPHAEVRRFVIKLACRGLLSIADEG